MIGQSHFWSQWHEFYLYTVSEQMPTTNKKEHFRTNKTPNETWRHNETRVCLQTNTWVMCLLSCVCLQTNTWVMCLFTNKHMSHVFVVMCLFTNKHMTHVFVYKQTHESRVCCHVFVYKQTHESRDWSCWDRRFFDTKKMRVLSREQIV